MIALDPSDPRHGSANGYNNLKCRCDRCKDAWAVYVAKQRLTRSGRSRKGQASPTHGREATYSNWLCRCAQCKEAHRVASARRARRLRARKRLAGRVATAPSF